MTTSWSIPNSAPGGPQARKSPRAVPFLSHSHTYVVIASEAGFQAEQGGLGRNVVQGLFTNDVNSRNLALAAHLSILTACRI